jgi:phosphate transport system protein
MALHFAETGGESRMLVGMTHLGEHVRNMLHDALDAFARMDTDAAIRVAKQDAKADRSYESILRELITYMMEDSRAIPHVVDVMWSARALERIGDRAKNICEYVVYLVKGKDVRHVSLDQVEAHARSKNRD